MLYNYGMTKERTEKREYDYKRYVIHALIAGAMALSWATVSHVDTYIHDHLAKRNHQTQTTKRRKSQASPTAPDELTTVAQAPTSPGTIAVSASVTIQQTKVDTNFIRLVEGSVLKGYVPLASTTRSGVTIADGFDLGQMTASEFSKLPISDALKAKLQPYVGLTSLKAQAYVKAHPLTINQDELQQLNQVAANKILQPLVKAYNQASGKSFLDLPSNAQTAIFSYAYQHGAGFMKKSSAGQLWHCFISQDWKKASQLLRASKMYASRRAQEANLLDKIA
jgi:GH24 family phage-related lysozyme (muramidase)